MTTTCTQWGVLNIIFIIIIILFLSLMIIREVKRKVIEKCLYGINTIEDFNSIFEIPRVTANYHESHSVTVETVPVKN